MHPERQVYFVRKMNYYGGGQSEKLLKIEMDYSTINKNLQNLNYDTPVYICHEGKIIFSNRDGENIGDEYEKFSDYKEVEYKKTSNIYGAQLEIYVLRPETDLIGKLVERLPMLLLLFSINIFFPLIMVLLLNRSLTARISRLSSIFRNTEDENLVEIENVSAKDEIGDLMRNYNRMASRITTLVNIVYKNRILEQEMTVARQKAELLALRSQINPHFLYNTLNSIKWMATIQGATGISEMTTSLSRLLKSISKGASLLIDIREELSLLENYFTIQSYRYGGTITMDIQVDNESLYNSEIIKFTLQPLVENAIFHGIEPKGCAGHIRIHVGYETSDNTEKIRIDVTDDGVGMTADKAAQVLRSNDDSSADFFREIGVSNVHKRLQYQFGAEYGITIESKEGEYTTMSIHIPNIPLHNNETVSSETISSENT